ncbi:MAG: UPF0182 family protein, partial [Bryobacteraceae bacterium]
GSMPQLKKVTLAMGNILIYADTYEQGLAQLNATLQGSLQAAAAAPAAPGAPAQSMAQAPQPKSSDPRIEAIRSHLQRYRTFAAQAKWAEAGKELEAIEAEAQKK